MDRDTQADDNAEHLYRYVAMHQPHINAWFVLRKTSHDWRRLKAEGFRLLNFGSWSHKMALLNASHVISSHAEAYITSLLPERYYRTLSGWKFTYLKHGVTKDEDSDRYNKFPIRHLVTSSHEEYRAIVAGDSNYKFSEREVSLTGMPRHDRLYEKHDVPAEKKIVIMPTWRQSLVGESVEFSDYRKKDSKFCKTEFLKIWCDLLASSELKSLAHRYGYDIVFFPHANLQPYLEEFRVEGIRVLGHADVDTIQDLFLSASVLVTDYSSAAFEMAYLQRPVLYYQFDEIFAYGGGHIYQRGYFDYRRDGFGPVSTRREALLNSLQRILRRNCEPEEPYRQRMQDAFAFRDGRCSARVFKMIEQG